MCTTHFTLNSYCHLQLPHYFYIFTFIILLIISLYHGCVRSYLFISTCACLFIYMCYSTPLPFLTGHIQYFSVLFWMMLMSLCFSALPRWDLWSLSTNQRAARTEGSDFVEMKLREDTTEWTDMSRWQGPNMLT